MFPLCVCLHWEVVYDMKDVWSNIQAVVSDAVVICVCVCTGRLSMI